MSPWPMIIPLPAMLASQPDIPSASGSRGEGNAVPAEQGSFHLPTAPGKPNVFLKTKPTVTEETLKQPWKPSRDGPLYPEAPASQA